MVMWINYKSNPEYHKQYQKRYYRKYKEIIRIQVKSRHFPLASFCLRCNSKINLIRHHPDYNEVENFLTLCRKCHWLIHKIYGNPSKYNFHKRGSKKVKKSRKQYMADYWIREPRKLQEQKIYYRKIRGIVLIHYSALPPKCEKCGTEDITKLIVVGNKERRGKGLYCWLIKQKFPNGYKVLCRKCNK